VKIPPKEIASFTESGFKKYSATLVYGNDYGLISEKVQKIIKNSQEANFDESFNFIKLDYDEVNSDISKLESEIYSICFNQHRKIIHLAHASASMKAELKEMLENNSSSIVVVSSEELKPTSTLRKAFENSKNLACVACYHNSTAEIGQLIKKIFDNNGIVSDYNVHKYIEQKLGNDHQIAINEINKICLYFADTKKISLDDIVSFYTDTNSEISLDNFFENLVHGKIAKALSEIHYLSLQTNHITIVRQILSFFQRLESIKASISLGLSQQQAMAQIKPPIFYKAQPTYTKAISKLQLRTIEKLISKTIQLEIQLKTIYINPQIILDKFILEIGRLFTNLK